MSGSRKDTIKKEIIDLLPHEPGVYRYYNSEGKIIYVGKAKDLKNRVSSYFVNPDRLNLKTRTLVSKIADVKYTVVESEQDAFLLENNLIKQYQPRYNILLKDSKTYPWIVLKNEPFPRIGITRRVVKDGSLYFGPYSSAQYAHHLVDLIRSLFKLRTCNLRMLKDDIAAHKYKECLNMHIKKCDAPCIGKVSEAQYDSNIEYIKAVLKGNSAPLVREFKTKMMAAADALDFETAQLYKEKMELLNAHYNKSLIVQPNLSDIDVFSIVFHEEDAFGNYLRVSNGCIIQVLNLQLKVNSNKGRKNGDIHEMGSLFEKTDGEVLSKFMLSVYEILRNAGATPMREILVPFDPEGALYVGDESSDLRENRLIHVPMRGDKMQLLELSLKNAKEFMFQTIKQEALKNPEEKKSLGVEMLKRDLHLKTAPVHIECFDNSNIQGTNPVASCVVFKNGKPSKKDYRKFNIKTVVGANDFASMYEVVWRRYSRLLEEKQDLPQLIVVDGGRGQLDFAFKALVDLHLDKQIPIIGIAKRLEELVRPGDPNPLFLDKNSPSLKLIMQLRDEAHRFGITFHRSKRSKGQINSELSEIQGVGPATEEKLIRSFKSVAKIKSASFDELKEVLGDSAAQKVYGHFHQGTGS